MANTLRFKRGLLASLPSAAVGEPLFTTDTFDLYIGTASGTQKYQKFIASGTTSQLLRGDGSLLTMPIVLSSPANGEVLKYNGTNWVNSSDAGITGSGAAGQVAYFTGATTQGGSNNLFWDNANVRLGIGRNNPQNSLHISSTGGGAIYLEDSDATSTFNTTEISNNGGNFNLTTRSSAGAFVSSDYQIVKDTISSQYHRWFTGGTERVRLFNTGNFGIGTGATDSGQRLQVIGTSYFSDSVGIGTTPLGSVSLLVSKNLSTPGVSYGIHQNGSASVTFPIGIGNTPIIAASATVSGYRSFYTANPLIGAGATVSELVGYYVESNFVGATATYGFQSAIPSGTGRWNLYMNGTANNYMAGALGVGHTILPTSAWSSPIVVGISGQNKIIAGYLASTVLGATIGANNSALTAWADLNIAGSAIIFRSGGENDRGRIFSNGNFTYGGNVDSGYKFDVVGTFRTSTTSYLCTNSGNTLIGSTSDSGQRLQVTGDGYFSGSVGIGQTAFSGSNFRISKTLTGSASAINFYIDSVIQSDVTNSPKIIATTLSTQAAAFTIPIVSHFYANQGSIGAGSAITTQIGFQADNTLTGATNNYGFYGNIPSGTGRWNLYMNGTAANYLAGDLRVGTTTALYSAAGRGIVNINGTSTAILSLNINANTNTGGYLYYDGTTINLLNSTSGGSLLFSTANTERMRLDASGNLGLGVTPSAWNSKSRSFELSQTNRAGWVLEHFRSSDATAGNAANIGVGFYRGTADDTLRYINSFTKPQIFGCFDGAFSWYQAAAGTAGNTITLTEAMKLDASGNLLLGDTASTGERLQVTGNGKLTANGANVSLQLIRAGAGGGTTTMQQVDSGEFYLSSTTRMYINTNGANRFLINNTGNVSIGTSPTDAGFKLDVNGTMRVTSRVDIQGSASGLSLALPNGSWFGASGTNRMAFDGVNQLFHTGGASGSYKFRNAGDTADVFTLSNTGAATFSSSVTAQTGLFGGNLGGANQRVANFRNSGGNAFIELQSSGAGAVALWAASANEFGIYQNATAGTIGTNVFYITSAANIGIGTFTPSYKLDVNGTFGATGAATFSSSVTAGARYIVSAASSAGISDISYGSLSGGAWINTPSSTNGYLAVAGNAALRWSASELNFYVSAAEAMRLDANGFGIGGVPAQKLDVQGSANSIQARFGNVAGRGLTIGTSAISGTNDAGVVFNAPTATDGTLVFQTSSTDRMTLNSSGLNVATAIAIGTTPDTNLPFKILKNINSTVGIRFENTSTGASAYSAVQFGTDVTGGTAFTNMVYGSSGITESGVYKPNGTSIINTGSGGLNLLAVSQPIRFFTSTGNGTLRAAITNDGDFTQYNGTNPSASTTDAFRMYSADITAGNAAPHFRTENGGIIKLYQQTTGVTSATYIGGAGTGLTDSDTFDGYTIAQIVKALRNAGLLA